RSLSARACDRPRRRRAQQHRHHARERHDHRNHLHPLRRAIDLHARRAPARHRVERGPRSRDESSRVGGGRMNRSWFSRAAIATIGALLTSTTAAAQAGQRQTVQLTLADAVRRAIEHNPDLAIVRLDTDVDAARVGESRGAYAPVFSTTLGRSRNVTPPTNYLLGDIGVDVKDWFSS